MKIEYRPTTTSDLVIPLVGDEATPIIVVESAEGFTNPRGRFVTTTGPGLRRARVREALPDLPVQMSLRGVFVAHDLEYWVRRYAAALDFMNGRSAGTTVYEEGVLRWEDANGALHRRVVPKEVNLPRSTETLFSPRFDFVFESYDPAWFNPSVQSYTFTGASPITATVPVGGNWPVFPKFTITAAGGGSFSVLTVKSNTDGGKQVSVSYTVNASSTLIINMDPHEDLALVGTASQQGGCATTDRRFMLYRGDNSITVSWTGTTPALIKAEWYELWPGI